MNPIYNEYIQFLKSKGVDYNLVEGYYWLDRQIIKAYDNWGNIRKILRLYTDDDLNLTYKVYKQNGIFNVESWEETVDRYKNRLSKLEQNSAELIKEILEDYKYHTPIIFTSGGKDSNVVTYLVREIINAKAYFNNTSMDCADTYKAIKKVDNLEIISPEEGFYQWRKRLEFIPTRFRRACCDIFKEGATLKHLDTNDKYLIFMGMRNEESATRKDYQDLYKNPKWNTDNWQGALPIRHWSEEDIWLYTMWKSIPINTKYKKGYARVGCAIVCPFYAKSTWVLDKYWYPRAYERWQRILKEDFIDNYKWTRMNCTLEEYQTNWNGGLVRKEPNDEVIKEFAEYKDIDVKLTEKYFSHTCKDCEKNVNQKDVIAMNMKLIHRNTEQFYCKKHLKEKFNLSNEQWDKYVEDFKIQGCSLF